MFLKLKKGLIITLFKGGRKRKDEPSSYRAISLSTVILKLYESILMDRIQAESAIKLSPLQGGFQKCIGCIIT